MLIAQQLEQLANTRSGACRRACLYILTHEDDVTVASMDVIAAASHTSKATLVRVAQLLGFTGWRRFSQAWERERITQKVNASTVDHNIPFQAETPCTEIAEAVAAVRAESARLTAASLDAKELAQAVRLIQDARRLALYGVNINAALLRMFSHKLLQLGRIVEQPEMSEMGTHAATLGEQDCVLMVSYTGEHPTRAPMRHIPRLEEAGCRIVALTGEGGNYLRDHADVILTILSRERLFAKVGTFSSEESTACLLDILYAALFAERYQANLQHRAQRTRAVEDNRLAE